MRSRASHGLLVLTVSGRESPDEGTKNESEEEEAASPEKPTSNGSEVSPSPYNHGVDRDPRLATLSWHTTRSVNEVSHSYVSPEHGPLQSGGLCEVPSVLPRGAPSSMLSQESTPQCMSGLRATGQTIVTMLLFGPRNYARNASYVLLHDAPPEWNLALGHVPASQPRGYPSDGRSPRWAAACRIIVSPRHRCHRQLRPPIAEN